MNKIDLRPGERIDDLERNGYRIIQREDGFCFGMDAVLLSGFAEVKKQEKLMDLCTGTGIIPILLRGKSEGALFYGLEIQKPMAEMAARSSALNDLSDTVRILWGDLRKLTEKGSRIPFSRAEVTEKDGRTETTFIEEPVLKGSFQVVSCNPPYMKCSHGLQNPEEAKAIARHEVKCDLSEVCAASAQLLCDGGRFYLVHRPQRISEIFTELQKNRLEPKRMKFVHPYIDREANMVLIEAVKGAKSQCRIEKPIIVYREPGKYTDEIYEIYGY